MKTKNWFKLLLLTFTCGMVALSLLDTSAARTTFLSPVAYLPLVSRGGPVALPTSTPRPVPTPPAEVVLLREDFEETFPGLWTVYDGNGADYGEYYWAKRSCNPYKGSFTGWAVGGGAQGSQLWNCGGYYPNNVKSAMVYGPFSLEGAQGAYLTFELWLNSERNYDHFFWGASVGGYFYGYAMSGSSQFWVSESLDLTDVYTLGNLTGEPRVWIALGFESDSRITYPGGAFLDDIELRRCTFKCAPTHSTFASGIGSELVRAPVSLPLEVSE